MSFGIFVVPREWPTFCQKSSACDMDKTEFPFFEVPILSCLTTLVANGSKNACDLCPPKFSVLKGNAGIFHWCWKYPHTWSKVVVNISDKIWVVRREVKSCVQTPWLGSSSSFAHGGVVMRCLISLRCIAVVLGPIHTGRGTWRAMPCKQMGPVDMNGGVHTACKQHQRKNVPICTCVASPVLCGWGLEEAGSK